jgi:hypothetical protein
MANRRSGSSGGSPGVSEQPKVNALIRRLLLVAIVVCSVGVGAALGHVYATRNPPNVKVMIQGTCQVIWPDFLVPRRS